MLEADALVPLVRLRELRLDDNQIKSLALAALVPGSPAIPSADSDGSSFAGCMPSLCVLHLAGNRLADLGELERLAALPSLLEVSLAGNPLVRKQVSITSA